MPHYTFTGDKTLYLLEMLINYIIICNPEIIIVDKGNNFDLDENHPEFKNIQELSTRMTYSNINSTFDYLYETFHQFGEIASYSKTKKEVIEGLKKHTKVIEKFFMEEKKLNEELYEKYIQKIS